MASSDVGGGKGNQNWGKIRHNHQEFELGFSFSGSNSYQSFTQKMKNVSLNLKPNEAELGGSDSSAAAAGVLPLRPHAEDCSYYMRTGSCRFWSKCKYNHPLNRPIPKAEEEAGTETGSDENSDKSSVTCKFHLTPGGCKNGESCKYLHSKPESTMATPELPTPELPTPELNFMGLPMREGEKECPFFMRNGSCAYGQDCKFHHPDPTPDEGSDSFSSTLNAEAEGYYGSTSRFISQEPFSQRLSRPTRIIPNYGGFYMDNPTSYMPVANLYSEEFHQTTEWSGYQVPEYPPQEKQPPRSISRIKTKMDKLDLSKKAEESSEDAAEPKSPVTLPPPPPKREPVELNELGLPLRPGKEICWHHENYGLCRRGRVCPFDHPMDKRSKNLPDMSKSGTKEVTPDEDEVYIWNETR